MKPDFSPSRPSGVAALSNDTDRQRRLQGPRQSAGKSQLRVLERLTSLGLAARGVEISCSNCGMTAFEELSRTEERAVCPGCRSTQQYSVEHAGLKLAYRLNSLVDRASDNGVLGHVLVVGALLHSNPSSHVVAGVDVEFADGRKAELDLLGFHGKKVIAGEVKLAADQFTNVRRDIELSKKVGADVHVMACTDDLPEPTRQAATNLATRNRIELLILDRHHLRPT